MPQPIDAAKALRLIADAERIRTELQLFIDAMRSAADATIGAADVIDHPPAGGGAVNRPIQNQDIP